MSNPPPEWECYQEPILDSTFMLDGVLSGCSGLFWFVDSRCFKFVIKCYWLLGGCLFLHLFLCFLLVVVCCRFLMFLLILVVVVVIVLLCQFEDGLGCSTPR